MGQLVSYLDAKKEAPDIILDLENAKPSPDEQAAFDAVQSVLERAPAHVRDLQNYKGCGELIRKALTSPNKDTEAAAWESVVLCVDSQKVFFDYAQELGDGVVAKLFKAFCANGGASTLENQQALAFQLASLLDFVLVFDEAKMGCPHLQNDFSYYRRTINRLKLSKDDPNVMKDEVANRVSLFFAYPSPMMKTVVEASAKILDEGQGVSKDRICEILALFANICEGMVERKQISNDATIAFALRAMVGSIIVFDHIHPLGAFHRKSPILLKKCILLLKRQPKKQDGLLNALKYTTIHLTDSSTPGSISQLLND